MMKNTNRIIRLCSLLLACFLAACPSVHHTEVLRCWNGTEQESCPTPPVAIAITAINGHSFSVSGKDRFGKNVWLENGAKAQISIAARNENTLLPMQVIGNSGTTSTNLREGFLYRVKQVTYEFNNQTVKTDGEFTSYIPD